jgi:hypothetical protein
MENRNVAGFIVIQMPNSSSRQHTSVDPLAQPSHPDIIVGTPSTSRTTFMSNAIVVEMLQKVQVIRRNIKLVPMLCRNLRECDQG